MKLALFYKLYINLNIFNNDFKINLIQLIFFYDTFQIENIKTDIITNIINNNCLNILKKDINIPIHFYVVYTLPTISIVSISNLSDEIEILKKENNNQIKRLNEKINEQNEKINEQNEKINELNESVIKLMNKINGIKNEDNESLIDKDAVNVIKENFDLSQKNDLHNDLLEIFPNEEENINNKIFSNIDKLERIEENKISDDSYKFNQEEKTNKIDTEILNKFFNFMKKYENNNFNKNKILPPHIFIEEEKNILNEFMDLLSNEELKRITDFNCSCYFCLNCRLKLSLITMKK